MVLRPALVAVLLLAAVGCGAQGGERPRLLVFAATSLTEALDEIARAFEAQGDADVAFSYGGSQMLAQQIASGAPADVFITAGQFPMESLAEKRLIEAPVTNLLTNKLVVVTRPGGVSLDSLEQLKSSRVARVAIASPDLAPAGRYAMESLTRLGLWDALRGKLVQSEDVRVALAYVQSGNADAALVYQTDAEAAPTLRVFDIVPQQTYTPIVYPAAVVRASQRKEAARLLLRFLEGEQATTIFRKHGFRRP